jgi:outer membrane biosynthesis protein TonB
VALLPWVQERLRPRLLVVKSEALAAAAEKWLAMEQQEQQEQRQQEQQPGQQAEQQPEQQLEQQPEQQQQQQQEQEQEQEQQQQQEQQQPHRQPQDRQEEQVQDQQQEQQQEQQPEEQQKQHQEQRQQVQKDCPRESTNAAADAEAACASSGPGCSSSSNSSRGMDAAGPPPLCPPRIPGTLRDPSGWWRQLQARCSDRPEAVANNPLFYKAKAKGFRGVHPMRFPDRRLPGGARICRPFNYAVCREGAGRCEYDHDHCHHCLQAGHRARECTL